MPYTEFRKSYGDFEVVIPPVDFSSLTRDEAVSTAKRLRAYTNDFVCYHLSTAPSTSKQKAKRHAYRAVRLINNTLGQASGNAHPTLGHLIEQQLNSQEDETIPFFGSISRQGIVLRKAWCNHMAAEIEREFSL